MGVLVVVVGVCVGVVDKDGWKMEESLVGGVVGGV